MIRNGIEYRPWPRDPRYLAGEDGSIIGARGYVLPRRLDRDGRVVIGVRVDGKSRQIRAHVVIAEAWHGPRPAGREAAHGNGDQTDNRPANLRWATPAENAADKILHGTHLQGERVGGARLTTDDVRAIRAEYATGKVTQQHLADRYGVNKETVRAVVVGETWSHIEIGAPPPWAGAAANSGERNPKARLTADAVRAIRQAAAEGATRAELARRYGISGPSVLNVVRGRTWAHVDGPPPLPDGFPIARGERNGSARLTTSKVRGIRAAHTAGTTSLAALARQFGVAAPTVQAVIVGETWSHVTDKEQSA